MSKYLFRGLAHIGITTDNPERCAKFYIDNLGFRFYYQKDLGEIQLWFVENGSCVVEFVSRGEVNIAGTINHIALEVQGIEALVADLRSKGVEFEADEIKFIPNLFPNGVKNIFIKGPAGERIELFDYTKQ